jgi:hypothetical protein
MMMTASTVYDAVEPQIAWKMLLAQLLDNLVGDGTKIEAVQMMAFILNSFAQDEEITTLHLPIVYAGIVDVVDVSITLR